MTPPRERKPVEDVALPPDPEPSGAMVGAHQLRVMSALLARHGIKTDAATYDYLTLELGREVTSRKELTTVEAAHIIAALNEQPAAPGPDDWAALRAPFPDEAIGKLPKSTCRDCSQSNRKRCDNHGWLPNCPVCNGSHSNAMIHLDYVGHADVTDRLLSVDPAWSWEPFTVEQINALPPDLRGGGLWIHLTILGVTRPGFGDGKNAKECIGDAIRNAAMRFGVALDLWAKGDRDWAGAEKHDSGNAPASPAPTHTDDGTPIGRPTPVTAWNPSTADCLEQIDQCAAAMGSSREEVTAQWRASHNALTVEGLSDVPAAELIPLVQALRAHVANLPKTG